MGLLNNVGMINKAIQAQNKIKKIQVAGQSDYLSVLMNGLSDVDVAEIDRDAFSNFLGSIGFTSGNTDKLMRSLEENIKNALRDAKKQLEKELRNATSMEDLKGILGN